MQNNNKIFIFMTGIIVVLLIIILFINKEEKQKENSKKITKLEKIDNDGIVANPRTRANKKIIKRLRHKSSKIKKLKKERRKQMLKRIKEKLYLAEKEYQEKIDNDKMKRGSTSATPSDHSNKAQKPQLDKDYIKEQVGEIIPFIKECYNDSLEENPELNGKVVVSFTIIGDPDVGGMIETSEFLENSMKGSENFNNCILDSLYEMELEAPENNGKMKVSYPFVFNNKKK